MKNNSEIIFGKILENLPTDLSEERIEDIFSSGNIKIERITSRGQNSPTNFWYNQEQNEFVYLVKGNAEIEFENNKFTPLFPGDYLIIPAHKKHRVAKTTKDEETVWLTFYW